MDWEIKAMLTASTVAAVLTAVRVCGRHAAGLLAGMPVITAPALAWVAIEHGDRFAASAAAGCVALCSALALFAPCYARLARRAAPLLAAALALLCMGLVTALLPPLGNEVPPLLALAVTSCVGASALMPADRPRGERVTSLRGEVLLSALAAGAVSALVTRSAPLLGPFWSSVAISLPIVTTTSAVHQHLTTGAAGVTRLMHGNLAGTAGRALFCTAFALTVEPLTVVESLALSCAAGILGAVVAATALGFVQQARARDVARRDRTLS